MIEKAIFAGGCFWCMVKPFDKYKGVISVISGYTGGHVANPTYEEVCSHTTGHYEAVEITFDNEKITFLELLNIFWKVIDPTDEGGQFNDRGENYKTAIFYTSNTQKDIAEKSKQDLIKSNKFDKPIVTQIIRATMFYPAEEYHQYFYKKNPLYYSGYERSSRRAGFIERTWGKKKTDYSFLTPLQRKVTLENGTEPPFENEFWDNHKDGLYVDIIDGTPLFTSFDKFDSSCGWPSFSKPINQENVVIKDDYSLGMLRSEVRSIDSNAHLGHVFNDGPKEKGGLRYCINSASLKFIPYEELDKVGYKEYKILFKKQK